MFPSVRSVDGEILNAFRLYAENPQRFAPLLAKYAHHSRAWCGVCNLPACGQLADDTNTCYIVFARVAPLGSAALCVALRSLHIAQLSPETHMDVDGESLVVYVIPDIDCGDCHVPPRSLRRIATVPDVSPNFSFSWFGRKRSIGEKDFANDRTATQGVDGTCWLWGAVLGERQLFGTGDIAELQVDSVLKQWRPRRGVNFATARGVCVSRVCARVARDSGLYRCCVCGISLRENSEFPL